MSGVVAGVGLESFEFRRRLVGAPRLSCALEASLLRAAGTRREGQGRAGPLLTPNRPATGRSKGASFPRDVGFRISPGVFAVGRRRNTWRGQSAAIKTAIDGY
jgi:hypothetical protein